jgi:hypothetical protein
LQLGNGTAGGKALGHDCRCRSPHLSHN